MAGCSAVLHLTPTHHEVGSPHSTAAAAVEQASKERVHDTRPSVVGVMPALTKAAVLHSDLKAAFSPHGICGINII